MQNVVTAIIKCLSKKYFLFRGLAWKFFVVCIISHKCTANVFVGRSGLKTLFHGDYRLQQYILVVQVSYVGVKIFFVSWLDLKTFCSLYYQANKLAVRHKNFLKRFFFCYPSTPNKFKVFCQRTEFDKTKIF